MRRRGRAWEGLYQHLSTGRPFQGARKNSSCIDKGISDIISWFHIKILSSSRQ